MPNRDGKGPTGKGPTGRKLGPCKNDKKDKKESVDTENEEERTGLGPCGNGTPKGGRGKGRGRRRKSIKPLKSKDVF